MEDSQVHFRLHRLATRTGTRCSTACTCFAFEEKIDVGELMTGDCISSANQCQSQGHLGRGAHRTA